MQNINARHAAKISPRSIALILLAVVILVSGIYFARRSGTDPLTYSNDFNVYYYAAREMTAGRDPYQNSLGDWIAYLYPPLLAEFLIPLAMLPVPVAAYLWFLISAAATLSAAWMSASLVASDKESAKPAPLYSRRVLICGGRVACRAQVRARQLRYGAGQRRSDDVCRRACLSVCEKPKARIGACIGVCGFIETHSCVADRVSSRKEAIAIRRALHSRHCGGNGWLAFCLSASERRMYLQPS